LKKSISQGGVTDGQVERLAALDTGSKPVTGERSGSTGGSGRKPQPRAVWSTSFGTGSLPSGGQPTPREPVHKRSSANLPATRKAPPPPSGRAPFVVKLVATIAIGAGAVAGGIAMFRDRGPSASSGAPGAGTTALELRSQPPGAYIIIDGSPTGLKTPATLTGLPVGRSVRIGLDKEGYGPVSQQTMLQEGAARTLSFTLTAATGTVRVIAPPRNAAAFLDEAPVDVSKPLAVPAGKHRLRIEAEDVSFSRTIDVRAGDEVVVNADEARSNR